MPASELHHHYRLACRASPEALWPLVSDTNRFDYELGLAKVERVGVGAAGPRMRMRQPTGPVEWEEEPYEWVRPYRFGVVRRYFSGPVRTLRVELRLTPNAGNAGGCALEFHLWFEPRHALARAAIRLALALRLGKAMDRTYRRYDALALGRPPGADVAAQPSRAALAPGGPERLAECRRLLLEQGVAEPLLDRLIDVVTAGDDLAVARLRPFALADQWVAPRRDVLELCLLATRVGLLEFRWDVLCPMCRGAKHVSSSLAGLQSKVHCEACRIDFTADFDRLVEITFKPSPAIRPVELREYCIGGPGVTPHIVVQQRLKPGESRTITPALETGRHRLRTRAGSGGALVDVSLGGIAQANIPVNGTDWPAGGIDLSPAPAVTFTNPSAADQLVLLERLAWTDQAVTAAQVTTLQRFRDLFSSEALRPGEQISVGSLAVLFTDLRDSTRLYRQIGDAPAFGRVMTHFDAVRNVIARHDGAVVKLMGDAVMAVFRSPANALHATLEAQRAVAATDDPLLLKAGLHFGPCIAINQNDRLDYFGSTVNLAARLEALSNGRDVVVSHAVRDDPEVRPLLAGTFAAEAFESELKGFDRERFELFRVTSAAVVAPTV